MAGHEYGKTMKYPYTLMGKIAQFPWKHHFNHGRGFRYVCYALVISYPVFYQLHKFVQDLPGARGTDAVNISTFYQSPPAAVISVDAVLYTAFPLIAGQGRRLADCGNVDVNSPGNIEMWQKVRAKRHHDTFARPTE